MGRRRSRWRRQGGHGPGGGDQRAPGSAGGSAAPPGASPDDDLDEDAGNDEDAGDDEEASPRLSQPAVEMVSDLQAAIGAFEIASPIQQLPGEEATIIGLDSWTETADDTDSDLDDVDGPPPLSIEPLGEEEEEEEDEGDPVLEAATGDPDVRGNLSASREKVDPVVEAQEELQPAAVEIEVTAVVHEETIVVEVPVEMPPAPVREEDPVATALELNEAGDRPRAVAMLRGIVSQSPGDARARRALIAMLEAAGDTDAALALVESGLERMPDEATLLVARASLHMVKVRHESAELDLRRALKVDESNIDALTMLGLVCTKRGRWREAVEPLRKAADLAPERPAIHYYLGEALNRLDRLPEALASYERAAALEPQNWRAHKGVGIVLDRLSRPQDAAEAYRRARETHRP